MNILIELPDHSFIQIPLVDGTPDFTGISALALPKLIAAYESGNYKNNPSDLQPLTVIPNWQAFIKEMDKKGLFMIGLTANFAVFTQIFNMLLALCDKQSLADDDSIEWRNFKLMYTLGRVDFSSSQLAQIEAAMILANIPLIE